MVPFQQALEILRELGDDAAYERAYPEGVLLFEPLGEGQGSSVDTPPDGKTPYDQTSAERIVAPQVFASPVSGLVHPDAKVAWLRKTDRNPFVGLVTVGRARNNDIVLEYRSVSKLHAIFHRHGMDYLIEDRKSTNGTFVDGVQLPAEERRALNDGASIRLADSATARFFEAGSFWGFCQLLGGL